VLGTKLGGGGEIGQGYFGGDIAINSTGTIALVAGILDSGGAGAVWMFTHYSALWQQEGSKITGRNEVYDMFGDDFGIVAMSSTGGIAMAACI